MLVHEEVMPRNTQGFCNLCTVAMKVILSTMLLVVILLSWKTLEPTMHTIEERDASTEPENYVNDSVAAAFALNTTGVPLLTTIGGHRCENLNCAKNEKCFVGSLVCEYRFCPLLAFCERTDEEMHLGPKTCDKVSCEPGYDCALRKVSSDPNNTTMIARCIKNEYLIGYENPKLCDDRACRGLSCIRVEKQCDKHFCGYIDKCVGIEEMLPWAYTCKHMNCLRDGVVCYKGIEDPFCQVENCVMKTKCQRYFEESSPCKHFECPKGTKCSWKKPWCDFSPCPYMVYCAHTFMDILGGPMTCDDVYCSPGFECDQDLTIHCPPATCLRKANCLRKDTALPIRKVIKSCKDMPCKPGYECVMKPKNKCEDPPCSSPGDDLVQPFCEETHREMKLKSQVNIGSEKEPVEECL